VSYKISVEVERIKRLKEAKERYDAFVEDDFDKKQIAEYFRIGVKAEVFVNPQGKVLTDKDSIMFLFYDSKFQYSLRRRPVRR